MAAGKEDPVKHQQGKKTLQSLFLVGIFALVAILFSLVNHCSNFGIKRAKMDLYCSPDYQLNWHFGSGEEV